MPTPPKSGPVPPQYWRVDLLTINGPETRVYKARAVGDIINKVRTSSALGCTSIKQIPFETYRRLKRK